MSTGMSVILKAKKDIIKILEQAGVKVSPADIVFPPNPEMGDLSVPLFRLAQHQTTAPSAFSKRLEIKLKPRGLIKKIMAAGPYVNFFLNTGKLTKQLFTLLKTKNYGGITLGKKKKYLVEFSCANPMKAFHLGHLRNTITGESVARILENAGYKVIRVNYQGDIGMHIAKSLWGLQQRSDEFKKTVKKNLNARVEFLGQAYTHGAKAFEDNVQVKQEILDLNKKIYAQDPEVKKLYQLARRWSLEKFETLYKKLGTRFDEYYFEAEMWKRGMKIVQKSLKQGVFKKSDGAIIFPGSGYGLHDRVFITSEGNPTYEAKDLALAEKRHRKHHPDKIIHVVGKEQTEYFKVVFKALEFTLPESKGKEYHLPGGFLQLKHEKMSSRTGSVITAETLLDDAQQAIREIMKDHKIRDKKQIIDAVSDAVVKYAILKNSVSTDMLFDMKESVSLSGDSGPYLLYIVARIKSILRKSKPSQLPLDPHPPLSLRERVAEGRVRDGIMSSPERQLILSLARFPEITQQAALKYDPSIIAHYLFDLAQKFNAFYNKCPVLKAQGDIKKFRLALIQGVLTVMTHGLNLLGIKTVEEM